MQLQISLKELTTYKSRQLVPLKCKECGKVFYNPKNRVLAILKGNRKSTGDYCSRICQGLSKNTQIKTTCDYCNQVISKTISEFNKSEHHFCNSSCFASFNNRIYNDIPCLECNKTFHPISKETKFCSINCYYNHSNKTTNTIIRCSNCNKEVKRKTYTLKYKNHFCNKSCRMLYSINNIIKPNFYTTSKLERFLKQYILNNTTLNGLFNNRTVIKPYELDLYFPDHKIAFEFNGPAHYKPMYGNIKFLKRQQTDIIKVELCKQQNIKLIVFDVSNDGKFTEQLGNSYLNQILKMVTETGIEPAGS